MRKLFFFFWMFIFAGVKSYSQENLLDSLVKQNLYTLSISNNQLVGSGVDFIKKIAPTTQFFSLGEEHFTYEIPIFTTALFELLQSNGFEYLALENDPAGSQLLSISPFKGRTDSAFNIIKKFPFSVTFGSDQEVEMIANVAKASRGKGRAVWGCDQSFGATHVLSELIKYAPTKDARLFTQALIDSAWIYEYSRDLDVRYMPAKSRKEYFEILKKLYTPKAGSRREWLINTLIASADIYTKFRTGRYYENNYIREEYMKTRFMEEYNYALAKDGKLPKVILKFGHWHIVNGLGPGSVLTTGTFVRSLAKINELSAFNIYMEMWGKPGTRYDYTSKSQLLSIFFKHSNINDWTIIDLRPFRHELARISKRKLIDEKLAQRLSDMVLAYDALLLFGSGNPGTYNWKKK